MRGALFSSGRAAGGEAVTGSGAAAIGNTERAGRQSGNSWRHSRSLLRRWRSSTSLRISASESGPCCFPSRAMNHWMSDSTTLILYTYHEQIKVAQCRLWVGSRRNPASPPASSGPSPRGEVSQWEGSSPMPFLLVVIDPLVEIVQPLRQCPTTGTESGHLQGIIGKSGPCTPQGLR